MSTHKMIIAVALMLAAAEVSAAQTPESAAKALGFTHPEIREIQNGHVVGRRLQEGSDQELAGVVAVFIRKPLDQVAEALLRATMPDADKNTQTFRIWDPKRCPDDPFADGALGLGDMPEARLFAKAARGDKLNLSISEIDRFKAAGPTLDAGNAALRAVLRDRYAAYLKNGLKGIASYARVRKDASPADEMAQALRETISVVPGKELIESLLSYPADRPADVRDRFYWNKQTVEDRPTFLLVHRAESRGDDLVLVTEAQFYVGHSYNSNFMAAGGLAVNGGSLVFYVNRTFTDQVAGFGSGTKHAIGRRQMLGEISSNLSHIREALLR